MSDDDSHDDRDELEAEDETHEVEEQYHELYVHVYDDGEIFLLPSDTNIGIIADLSRLRAELMRLHELDGVVFYTVDPQTGAVPQPVSDVMAYIAEFQLECHPLDVPHPAVYGYHKSFVPHIEKAVEAAELDVEGLTLLLEDTEAALNTAELGTKERRELSESQTRLREELEQAEYALKRLLDIQLEICTEAEGQEQ